VSTSSTLELRVFTSSPRALVSNAVLVCGEEEAILVDTALTLADARDLVHFVRSSGRRLTTVLITHAHPDHYFGMGVVRDAFPDARILARPLVLDEMWGFRGKVLHWQEMYGPDEIPQTLELPERLEGDEIRLEGVALEIIDLRCIETLYATAFYLPTERALIAGDLVFADTHAYMCDIADADLWIAELERVRDGRAIDRVVPGHGPVGGPELIDAQVRWLEDWRDVARPGVRFVEIAPEMMRRYPDHALAMLLWMTRGPGFGLAGAAEIGVPPELLGG
jgi:glyoxylase-like metal-dependent hydrolase (beta-lactamase superfamily II)